MVAAVKPAIEPRRPFNFQLLQGAGSRRRAGLRLRFCSLYTDAKERRDRQVAQRSRPAM